MWKAAVTGQLVDNNPLAEADPQMTVTAATIVMTATMLYEHRP